MKYNALTFYLDPKLGLTGRPGLHRGTAELQSRLWVRFSHGDKQTGTLHEKLDFSSGTQASSSSD